MLSIRCIMSSLLNDAINLTVMWLSSSAWLIDTCYQSMLHAFNQWCCCTVGGRWDRWSAAFSDSLQRSLLDVRWWDGFTLSRMHWSLIDYYTYSDKYANLLNVEFHHLQDPHYHWSAVLLLCSVIHEMNIALTTCRTATLSHKHTTYP